MVAALVSTGSHPKAVFVSIAFHAVIAAGMVSATLASVQTMPQQMIELSFEALPAAPEHTLPKPEAKTPPAVKKTPLVQKTSALPQEKTAMLPAAPAAKEVDTQTLASISPAAGQPTSVPKTASIATTKPMFEAAYLRNPAPDYPSHAKRRGMQGSVMLSVLVSREGTAAAVHIAESSGFSLLDDSAKDAVSRWKFVPAKRGEETVEARVMVPVEFRLQ
jgi:protein TonB